MFKKKKKIDRPSSLSHMTSLSSIFRRLLVHYCLLLGRLKQGLNKKKKKRHVNHNHDSSFLSGPCMALMESVVLCTGVISLGFVSSNHVI